MEVDKICRWYQSSWSLPVRAQKMAVLRKPCSGSRRNIGRWEKLCFFFLKTVFVALAQILDLPRFTFSVTLFVFLTEMSKISHSAHQPLSPRDEEGMILTVPYHPWVLNPRDWPLMYSQPLIESWGPVEKASCYGSPENEDTKTAAGSWLCLVLSVCDEQGL